MYHPNIYQYNIGLNMNMININTMSADPKIRQNTTWCCPNGAVFVSPVPVLKQLDAFMFLYGSSITRVSMAGIQIYIYIYTYDIYIYIIFYLHI